MHATSLPPSAALRPFVKQFLVVETEADDTSTLLPATSLVLGFRFGGIGRQVVGGQPVELPRFTMAGLRDSVRTLTHEKGGILLATFTETGAAALLREPVDSLFNATIPFDCLVDRTLLRPLEDRLFEAKGHAERAEELDRFLLSQLRDATPDFEVAQALASIRSAHGSVRIAELAQRAGLSQSAFERRFRKTVGTSPKLFASIVRLQYVVDRQAAGGSLAEIAHDAGYFDQPHFVKDFKAFTGQAPESFFRTHRFW